MKRIAVWNEAYGFGRTTFGCRELIEIQSVWALQRCVIMLNEYSAFSSFNDRIW